MHRRRIGLQPGQRLLIGRKPPLPIARVSTIDKHLPGFHQHALGVTEQLGVPLGGALVKTLDRAGVAGLFPQPGHHPAAGGPGGETG